jgi:hypothetical protein
MSDSLIFALLGVCAVSYFLAMFTRFVRAQERMAGALEEVARKMK